MHQNCDLKLSSHLKLYKHLLRISSTAFSSSSSFFLTFCPHLRLFFMGMGSIRIRLGNARWQPPLLEEARGSQVRELEAEPSLEGIQVGE